MIVTALLHRIGIGFLVAGTVIFIVAFSTPHWFQLGPLNVGLWKTCSSNLCFDDSDVHIKSPSWIVQPQVLESIGLVFALLALVLSTTLFFLQTKAISRSVIAASFLAGIFGLVGAIDFVAKVKLNEPYRGYATEDWSFDINILADFFLFVAGIFHTITYLKATSGYMNIP